MTTILIADDQPLPRMGFRMLLDGSPGVSVVGEADNGAQAVRMAAELSPDVVLMDVRMPGLDGIEATRRIVAAGGRTRVLILTTFDLDEYAYAGLRAGASGFLLKDVRRDDLTHAVRMVAAGEALLAPSVTRRLIAEFAMRKPGAAGAAAVPSRGATRRLETLTAREQEILRLIARGLSNGEIAAELQVSDHTVKSHVSNLLSKLGLRDRVHAVAFAYEAGAVVPGEA